MPQNSFEQLKMSKKFGGLTAPPKPPAEELGSRGEPR